jgi:hypothetical protein
MNGRQGMKMTKVVETDGMSNLQLAPLVHHK